MERINIFCLIVHLFVRREFTIVANMATSTKWLRVSASIFKVFPIPSHVYSIYSRKMLSFPHIYILSENVNVNEDTLKMPTTITYPIVRWI